MSTVDVDYDYIDGDRETKHAYFVVFEQGFDKKSCFVPKSQVEVDEQYRVITIPVWMASEKELI